MAERMRFTRADIAMGVGVLLVVFVLVFFAAGALELAVPQWLLRSTAALIGVAIWFAVLKRRKA
jgi:hypothetical protein